MNRSELLGITKRHKKEKVYVIDELLRARGHKILRIPPYNCDFNAIELIWAHAKGYYNKHVGRDGYGDRQVLDMWQEFFLSILTYFHLIYFILLTYNCTCTYYLRVTFILYK